MVAGHLREQNGIYQIILSYKDANGKRKTKQISTGLKIRGNARNAERMLQQARQEFIPPEMAAEQGKEVNPEELSNLGADVAAHQSNNRNLNDFSETTIDKLEVNLTSSINTNKQGNKKKRIMPQLEELLVKLLRNQQLNAKLFGDSYNKELREYINVDPMGNLIKPNFVTQHFRLVCDKNELKHIRFHDLRHSCATLLYDSGIDMKAIQEWLGHSNISTTMNIYAHLNYKNKVISANAIARIIPNYKEKEPRTAAN